MRLFCQIDPRLLSQYQPKKVQGFVDADIKDSIEDCLVILSLQYPQVKIGGCQVFLNGQRLNLKQSLGSIVEGPGGHQKLTVQLRPSASCCVCAFM